jgi:hypothetical protein
MQTNQEIGPFGDGILLLALFKIVLSEQPRRSTGKTEIKVKD